MEERFRPEPWARNAHLQTIFASSRLRLLFSRNEMLASSSEVIVNAGQGVRLLGYHSRQKDGSPKALIILLHGWEGSADSAYILSAGRFFYRRGYDIFRLNLRDHGSSHHLNPGLFHGALTDEIYEAVQEASLMCPGRPSYLIGFSLGGNFALRIAIRLGNQPSRIKAVFSISPPLDPYKATLAIDRGLPLYRHYFMRKWKRSLKLKERYFPDLYDFSGILHHRTCLGLTKAIMPFYPEFSDYRDYFRRYTLTNETLQGVSMPVTIFIAEDDPIVSCDDFSHLPKNHHLTVMRERYGGHCGFLQPFPFGCWHERRIAQLIEERNPS